MIYISEAKIWKISIPLVLMSTLVQHLNNLGLFHFILSPKDLIGFHMIIPTIHYNY